MTEEKSGYSLRARKPLVRLCESSNSDEESDEEPLIKKVITKGRPPAKSRKKNPDEDDPDFRDEPQIATLSPTKKCPMKRPNVAPLPMVPRMSVPVFDRTHTYPSTSRNSSSFQYIPILPKKTPLTTCSVRTCILNSNSRPMYMEKNITIHPFPCQPAVRYNWIKAVRPNQPLWQPFPSFGVCSLHFAPGAKPWCGELPTLNLPPQMTTTSTLQNKIIIQPGSVKSLKTTDSDYHQTLYGQKSKGFTISQTNLTTGFKPTRINFVGNGSSPASKNVSTVRAILPKGINFGTGNNRIGIRLVSKPTNSSANVQKLNFSDSTVFSNGINIVSNVNKTVNKNDPLRSVTVKVENESVLDSSTYEDQPKTNAVNVSNIMPGISVDEGSDDDEDDEIVEEDMNEDVSSESHSLVRISPTTVTDALPAIDIDVDDEDDAECADDSDGEIPNESDGVLLSAADAMDDITKDPGDGLSGKVFTVGDKRLIFKKTAQGYLAKSILRRAPLRYSTYDPQVHQIRPRLAPLPNPNMPRLDPQKNVTATEDDVNQILGSYVYKGRQTFFCSLCRLHLNQCTRVDICKHLSQHKIYKTLYECRLCGTTFDSFKFLFCHWKRRLCYRKIPFWMCTLNGNLIENWTCFVCAMNSVQSRCSSLIHHVQTMHADVGQTFNESDNMDFKCVVCGLQLYTANAYFNHIGRTHYHLCNVYQSDATVSLKYLEENTSVTRTTARFRGDSCVCQNSVDQTLPKSSTSDILSNYMILERYKRCYNCMKDFEFLRQLLSHTYNCSTKCPECSMKFFDFWSESMHRIFSHWLKKCPVCGLLFDKAETESTILRHFREIHKFSERELAPDRLCGYPTPLLFEDGAIYFCQTCHNEGNVLYFSLQSCLMRYHRFMRTDKIHRCVIISGNAESCIRNRTVSHSFVALCDKTPSNEASFTKRLSASADVKKILNKTPQVKIEPMDDDRQAKFVSNKDWELKNAISVVDDDDDQEENEREDNIVRQTNSDDVEIIAVDKPEPPLVDLSTEESKSYLLSTTKKSLHCWCSRNLHSRAVQKNRAWALRLNVCEWDDTTKCALCQRKSKSFLSNVTHVCAHFKCKRIVCDRCNSTFVEKKHCREHLKRCKRRFYGIKDMRVLVEKLDEKLFAAPLFPMLTEIEYLDSLDVKKKIAKNPIDDDDELRIVECDDDYEGAICKVGQCFKCFPNRDHLFHHIVDVHLTNHWKDVGTCCLCPMKFSEHFSNEMLRQHLLDRHWKDLYPKEFQMKAPRKRPMQRSPKKKKRNARSKVTYKVPDERNQQKEENAIHKSLFRCDECNLFFRASDEFETHMWQIHTGPEFEEEEGDEKSYLCAICKTTFRDESALKEHSRVPHPKYFCWKCTDSFRERRSCIRHVAVCRIESSPELIKEKLIHFGLDETKKRCELCSLNFPTKRQFIGHLRLHCCKYAAKCVPCKKRFFQFKDFFHHRKICRTK